MMALRQWFNSSFDRQTKQKLLAYVILPAVVGVIFVGKAFYLNDCYAFEENDEVAHTFVETGLVWSMLRSGQAPLMNLYNNFGTPMLGDPVILPFAPHSISYLLFPAYLASTINQLALIALSVALLTYFYRNRFSFSLLVSSLCAAVAVLLPSFNYFSVNYPHQGVLLYFVAVLIMQHRFKANPNSKNLLALYLSLLMFAFGVGINAFLFGLPFLVLNQLLDSRLQFNKVLISFAILLLAAVLPAYPHFAYFFQLAPLTARASLNFATLLTFTPGRLLADVLSFATQSEILHVSLTVYYSLPVILLAAVGMFEAPPKPDRRLLLILGCCPIIFVLLILAFGSLRDYLPFLKPVDVSRLLWFANVYFLAAVGYALEAMRKRVETSGYTWVAVAIVVCSLSVSVFYVAARYAIPEDPNQTRQWMIVLVMIAVVGIPWLFKRRWLNAFGVVALFLPVSFLPVLDYHLGLVPDLKSIYEGGSASCDATPFFHGAFAADFRPASFLAAMKPFSRMTAEFDPVPRGYLQETVKANIFGSAGRSITLSKDLRQYLLDKDLVTPGWNDMTYYFTSADLDEMSLLGIKYVMTSEPDKFRDAGWRLIASDPEEGVDLFENPRDISLAYLTAEAEASYIHAISYAGNEVTIDLQSATLNQESDLVLTFVNWPGWKAAIDGREAAIEPTPAQFLRVHVNPGDKQVKFTFAPFAGYQLMLYPLASVILFFLAAAWLKFSPKRTAGQGEGEKNFGF